MLHDDLSLTIRPLDAGSDTELAQYAALDEALDDHAFGGHEVRTLAQHRAQLVDSSYSRTRRWVALAETMEGGQTLVGRASVSLPLEENLETVFVGVSVHPAFRGLGIATRMVEEILVPAIEETGRPLRSAWGDVPADGDADDPDLPVHRLARRLGISRKGMAVVRAVELPVAQGLLDSLQKRADEKLGDYRIELWESEVPAQHLEAYGLLLRQLDLDDPDEDVEHEAADYTPARIREMEQRERDAGTRTLTAVAIAPDGAFAGNSVVQWQEAEGTTIGWQENTLVMPDHRGHRLGLALKVATHRRISALAPHLRSLITYNSHVNPWMIAVNEQLGYRVIGRELALQGRADAGGAAR